ncbi:MAG: tetratricopeptide repeat protein, partial [Deltaproteobacteria bacterium]|nr:tetratricopeptide repeat protein [Kofleriaceae bacterium]
REALRDIEAEWKRYTGQADEHHRRMRDLLLRSFDDKTKELERRYAKRIAEAETRRNNKHADTIALLEQFIKDHPDHKQFTPDAMYRLGDLYLDVADEAVDTADMTAEVIADYSKSLEYWERILAEFPDYRQMPSVLYLVGHYGKTKDERRSLMLFLALSCANKYKWTDAPPPVPTKDEALARTDRKDLLDPYADCQPWEGADPELVRHAWVRGIADYHFTVPGELDEAISAYNKVVEGAKDSPLYAEALYKLAWSFYKRDFLLDSIKRFDESVKLYDALVAKGGIPALELREESLQYIAVAFTDPWEGETDTDPVKAFQRARDFYQGRENEPHVRDVWEAMGAAFMELQAYDQAVDSYRIAIGPPWELHPRNPVVHQEIVNAFEAKGDKFAADQAAGELATRYAPGTAWYQANEKDREAMENQRRIAERALYAAARNTHLAATNLRKEWEAGGKTEAVVREEYLKLYAAAVDLYKTFIQQYPESDYVYEFTYYQGEALFFSERYLEAVEQYRWVRDHRELSEVFFLQAAKDILTSYEMEVARQVAAGSLQPLSVPTSAELKAMPQPLTPRPIPPLYLTMQKEWDEYQNVVNDPKTAPIQGLNAALVSLAYLHVDDAIARMEKVMNKFCGVPESVKAKDALLSVYEATGRLDKFTEVNEKFISAKCGDAKSIELAKSQNRSVEFKRAEVLSGEGKYIEAAETFYRYYKVAPAGDADLPTALYNAAANYSLGDRPKTAISLYKEFTQSKEKAFRESPYFLEAMRLTAMSQASVFDYDAAIATNLDLYAVAKDAKRRGIKPPPPLGGERQRTTDEIALEALFNAAALAELDRDFKQAVDLYNKYDREESDRRNKDRALFAIARIYRSARDVGNMTSAYDRWRKLYGKDNGNADDYVQSYYDTAMLWKSKGTTRNAEAAGQQAIDAWRAVGAAKNTRGAKLAGEWALYFAEKHFTTKFQPYKITESAKTVDRMKQLKTNLEKVTTEAQDKYLVLDDFGVAEYSMAAKVRFGETLSEFAIKLAGAPTPKFILDLDRKNPDAGAVAAYEDGLSQNLAKYVDQAKAQWVEVVDLAKRSGVSNKWSQLALENLNREFPDEFPVLHQELFTGTEAP